MRVCYETDDGFAYVSPIDSLGFAKTPAKTDNL